MSLELQERRQYWVWAAVSSSWETLRTKNIWATYSLATTSKVRQSDIIVFYLVGSGSFVGSYRVVSQWYESKELTWPDEIQERRKKYQFECRIEPVQIGTAVAAELTPNLSFVTNKANPGAYLRGSHGGPGNFNRPIPWKDYEKMEAAMKEQVLEAEHEESITPEHERIVSNLLEVGTLLGFEATDSKDETKVARGAEVDLAWVLNIGNFGEIRHVFEVQRRGSPKSVVLNLMQASRNESVRGLIVVGSPDQLEKVRGATEGLSEDFRRRVRFVTTDDVIKALDNLRALSEFRNKLGLQI